MVVKSRLVHGRACANLGISGRQGRVPVATTTGARSQDHLAAVGMRHSHCSFAAQPAEPTKHCYTGLPQWCNSVLIREMLDNRVAFREERGQRPSLEPETASRTPVTAFARLNTSCGRSNVLLGLQANSGTRHRSDDPR
jgi:hypothetical protein